MTHRGFGHGAATKEDRRVLEPVDVQTPERTTREPDRRCGALIAWLKLLDAAFDLRRLIEGRIKQLQPSDQRAAAPIWLTGSPFRGLDIYRFEHAPIFLVAAP